MGHKLDISLTQNLLIAPAIDLEIDNASTVVDVLAAVEAPDHVVINALLIGPFGSLAVTDGSDVAAFGSFAGAVTGTIAATEAPDRAAFSDGTHAGVLAATEAPDVASLFMKGRRHPNPVISVQTG